MCMLLLTYGDVKPNPGFSHVPTGMSKVLAHNELTLLTVYNGIHKYDVIYILETYLDSTVQDNNLSIN